MPRRRKSDGGLPNRSEINVISLVDVAFTLLVIFIITAPIMQGGVDVDVPRAQAEPLDSPDGLIVTVDRDGAIYIGDAEASWEEFEPALVAAVENRNVTRVFLKADQGVPYGEVLRVLGAMKATDVAAVGLVAEPEVPARGG